ncbi:MAG: glycosyltransferase family 4 protein [Fimbriimonadaceae bacterium]|nr:glycosyltransferase family 4 protein [Fimbriimonadaceae bacterium]
MLQIASSLYDWGGIERYVHFLANGLRARGHAVDIARPAESPLAARHLGYDISLARKFDLTALGKYLKLFGAHRYDVVHAHFSPDFTVPAIAAKLRRQPVRVMTRHVALPWSRRKASIYHRLWPHIIPVSNAVQRHLVAAGIPESSMIVAKAGCPSMEPNQTRQSTRHELGIGEREFAVGSFSRLKKEKGIDVFLRARPRASGVHGYIYGEGEHGEELARLSSFLRVASQVSFIGRVEDVSNHMHAMDAVVIPSVWEEAFPYAALEALSVGTLVIASNVGGLPEIVTEGETGMLFAKGNPEDLARALLEARESGERRRELAERGRELHRAEYTVERMTDRIEAAYAAFASRKS